MIVMKFGGTSVGSQERFEQVYGLIENAGKKRRTATGGSVSDVGRDKCPYRGSQPGGQT